MRNYVSNSALKRMLRAGACAALAWGMLSADGTARAQSPQPDPAGKKDLTATSIEDLMNVEITTSSKSEQKLSQTAAAVFVITQEDIRRSGANNIPDLLRMVPGMDVAQINANTWAISTRGMNARFSNELLVLLDGRPVYVYTFGGVNWDVLDLPLEDIQQIEVIRGPGGSVWGANAVNGVINIITKRAKDTHGTMVVAGGGNQQQGFGTLQQGGSIKGNTDYRVFAKYENNVPEGALSPPGGGDGWQTLRGGFRVDTAASTKDALSFEGDVYTNREGQPGTIFPSVTATQQQLIFPEVDLSGYYLQGEWTHTFSAHSETAFQISYDRYERDDFLGENRGTLYLDFHHHVAWGRRHDVVWGLGYEHSASTTKEDLTFYTVPPDLNIQVFSGFVQYQYAVIPDRLLFTAGTKLEHFPFSGFAVMPSARLAWTPGRKHTLWAAVSRALRTPAETDVTGHISVAGLPPQNGLPVILTIQGNPHVAPEEAVSYEAGYRAALSQHFLIDLAAYFTRYDDQNTAEPGAPYEVMTPLPAHLIFPLIYQNLEHGYSPGVEFYGTWKVTSRWSISPGYAFQRIILRNEFPSRDTTSIPEGEGSTPEHMAQLRSHVDLGRGLSWDTSAYFNSRLTDPVVPSYTRLDTVLSWKLRERAVLSLVGQNLVRDGHLEFVDPTGSALSTLIRRSAYAKITWTF